MQPIIKSLYLKQTVDNFRRSEEKMSSNIVFIYLKTALLTATMRFAVKSSERGRSIVCPRKRYLNLTVVFLLPFIILSFQLLKVSFLSVNI